MSEIPHYINEPNINKQTAPENKLFRPQINWCRALVTTFLFLFLGLVGTLIIAAIYSKSIFFTLSICISVAPWVFLILFVFCLRYTLIWSVRVYQAYAKSETRIRCCFTPSCSEYAILAIKKYGAIIGTIKTISRLFRCHPPGGVDYP